MKNLLRRERCFCTQLTVIPPSLCIQNYTESVRVSDKKKIDLVKEVEKKNQKKTKKTKKRGKKTKERGRGQRTKRLSLIVV